MLSGAKQTYRQIMSALPRKADIRKAVAKCPLLTQSGRWKVLGTALHYCALLQLSRGVAAEPALVPFVATLSGEAIVWQLCDRLFLRVRSNPGRCRDRADRA